MNNKQKQEGNKEMEEMARLIGPQLRTITTPKSNFAMIIHGIRGSGKRKFAHALARFLGVHFLHVSCFDLIGSSDQQTADALSHLLDQSQFIAPCVLLLRHLAALEKNLGATAKATASAVVCNALKAAIARAKRVVVIGVEMKVDALSPQLRSCFLQEISLKFALHFMK